MRLVINSTFGILIAVLFGIGALGILYGATQTVGYEPRGFRSDLFDLTSGGVVAFLVTVLGLAVANDQTTVSNSLKQATAGVANKGRGEWLIAAVGAIYILIGVCFILLAVFPGLIAVEGDGALSEAPSYVTSYAKAFVGVALAGMTVVGTALTATK